MSKIIDSKKYGIGSISLILSILGAMFSFVSWDGKELGKHVLNSIGISFSSAIISLIILCIAFFLAYKYKNDYLAKSGRIMSVVFILLIFILTISSLLF
ncbi:hypothetical protein FDB64_05430 [Clostridium botulinum]|uniref:hypothetical protein n=1 Tax=Clostridium botulinum TaxID=1491 RepID=UPI0013F0118C|nr:hypothetical protein [Clostridium botulinum]MBN1042759.1 hypothetical protein [Clostridium botulinum]MBY6916641.1 hypothetical protein [Clostridium botulinum]NFL34521.1 hypothetical protein [Clostridium botulinum]NFM04067.1 hypothetical protein [Clostridium botulinum]NFO39209.1 hypothetical protein [Clostridium botulinum]